jgi:hypothetical protein
MIDRPPSPEYVSRGPSIGLPVLMAAISVAVLLLVILGNG